jgi:putative membrane-bound dehydrogenase-like protein
MTRRIQLSFRLAAVLLAAFVAPTAFGQTVSLQPGDHICLTGNALGERLQHTNDWEALLHQQFADKNLVLRNLCFPGDEVYERIRSENFGTPDEHLTHSGATLVVYLFGYNESFSGVESSQRFEKKLVQLVKETRETDYGKGKPRVVLVSPIAFENTGDAHLPDGTQHNERLEAFTAAMKRAAETSGAAFVDVFHPTLRLFEESKEQLTTNGCHLSAEGYRKFAPVLMEAMFGTKPDKPVDPKVLAAVDDKNFHWWHRYRAVNGFSIYGTRGTAGGDATNNNRAVMERERAILDQMTANRDQRIWDLASGKNVSGPIDDSNTLPFLDVKTNVGGENDQQAKAGKLGSLQYFTSKEQLELFDVHEDFQVELVASEEDFPELANPVALGFDNAGKLYVATMPCYPQWQPKTVLNDKILLLEDDNQDGRSDRCIVFADGLHQPTGFEFGQGGMYIAEQPDILFVKDTDGDGKSDTKERLLYGFDSADSHHGIAAFEWSPGGYLHFQEGTFKFSQVESPYGLVRLGEGGIWAYHPRRKSIEAFVNFAFSNPWGHVFNAWGQSFIADASPGYSYWSTPITGRIDYPLKHPGGSQHRRVASIGGGDPDYQFPTLYPKRTRPSAGAALVSGDHFPESMQGNFLVTNVIGDRVVMNHEVREQGSGYAGTEVKPIISCRDGNFRPVDIEFAPDGTLYIVDWHNALIGHLQHNLRDPSRDHSRGRVWRVKHKTNPLMQPPQVAGGAVDDLLNLLKSTDDRLRYRVRRELAARNSDDVLPRLATWVDSIADADASAEHHRMEALWMYQTHDTVNQALLERMLASPDHNARSAAMKVLAAWIDRIDQPMKLIAAGIEDSHPRVRLESVRALSFSSGEAAMELALKVLEKDTDELTRYTLEETIRRLEQ